MDFAKYSKDEFEGLLDDEEALGALLSELEHEVMTEAVEAANRRLRELVDGLNTVGHRLKSDPALPFMEFVDPFDPKPTLRLTNQWMGSLSAKYEKRSKENPETPEWELDFFGTAEEACNKADSAGFDSLSEKEKAIYCLYWLDLEVNNGGISQYFWNSAGAHAERTERILREIGAKRTAECLKKAIGLFKGGNVPQDQEERARLMEEIEKENLDLLERITDKLTYSEENLYLLVHRKYGNAT